MSTVLVTGGSGFIGAHALVQLLAAGHRVRATVRSLQRADEVRAMLRTGGATSPEAVEFLAADLHHDQGWAEAVRGCEYVLHVASPLPSRTPRHEDELILPARDGALRVLRAARDAGVRRVVMTSSFAAIGYGHGPRKEPFTEADWTNLDGTHVSAYPKSKTLAERAAWDFLAREGGSLELSVINPVAVFGPVLGRDYSASILIVQRLLEGALPGSPRLIFGTVDVRDVVDLHLRAMTNPAAKGERFLAVSGDLMPMVEIARLLKERLGAAARKVPTREIPDWLLRVFALFNAEVRGLLPELGKAKAATSAKARTLLGWTPRPREEAVLATAESLLRLGLVKTG